MIRPQLLAATALTSTVGFLVPGIALAAPAHDWSGFYAGIGLGAAASDAEVDFTTQILNFGAPLSVKVPALGPHGDVRLGYNWQHGGFVYGLEADGSLLSLSGTATGTTYAITNSLNALLSIRARFGVVADRWLVYGSGGVVAGQSSFTTDVNHVTAGDKGITAGYVVGVGGEYALTDKISLVANANYYSMSPVSDLGYGYAASASPRGAIFETGVNVHF